MRFLSGASLRKAITRVSRGQNISLAVAFWGRGADGLIGDPKGRTIRLICNLKMGGTNPDVIAVLMRSGITVQQSDRLHAKVYIGDTQAVVTSANASINGLGLEGDELTGWIETGVEMPAEKALPWFEELWAESKRILPHDLEIARSLFRERAIIKPPRGTFANFHPTQDDFPLVYGVIHRNISYNDEEIKKSLGYVKETVYEQIDKCLDVEFLEDKELFHRGVWVLCWWSRADGMPWQRSKPWWTCSSGDFVPKAYTYEGKPKDVILAMHPLPPEPFDTSERRFRDAFNEVISRPAFDVLREQDYKESFCATRLEPMWQFWVELKRRYNELGV